MSVNEGPTTVGAIKAILELDKSSYSADLKAAGAEADALGAHSPTIKVKAETSDAVAKLRAVEAAERAAANAASAQYLAEMRLQELQGKSGASRYQLAAAEEAVAKATRNAEAAENRYRDANTALKNAQASATAEVEKGAAAADKAAKSNDKAAKSGNLLVAAIVGLGPGLVPLTSLAIGAGSALGVMGATGLLAVKGIEAEMAKGTQVGQTYKAVLNEANGILGTLEHTAAARFLSPFEDAVTRLRADLPQLNTEVGQFSVMTGHIAGNTLDALLHSFQVLQPLLRDSGVYLVDLSAHLDQAAQSQGFKSFVDYLRANLPAAEQTLESVVEAAIRLVGAFAPMGSSVLTTLKLVGDAVNGLPLPVLQELATAGTSVFLAFKAWSTLKGGIDGLAKSTSGLAQGMLSAAGGARTLELAAGGVSALLGIAAIAYTAHAASVQHDQQAVNSLTDALIASNGAIDENVRKTQFKNLQDAGAVDAAKSLGINLGDLTNAALGNADAMGRVNSTYNTLSGLWKQQTGSVPGQVVDNWNKVRDAINGGNTDLAKGKTAWMDLVAATLQAAPALSATDAALQQVALAHEQNVTATSADYKAIQALNKAMDEELSRTLTLAGATSSYDSALLSMEDSLKKNKGSLDENTQSGVQDRQAIEATVQALQQRRDAEIKAGDGTAQATLKYEQNSASLLQQMGKLYGTKSAAYAYAQQLLAIPKDVNTKLGIIASQADAQLAIFSGMLKSLPTSKTITLYVQAGASNAQALAYVNNSNRVAAAAGHADGGTVIGEGGPREDRVMTFLSPGEEVIQNGPAQKHRALLKAINAGKFANGGTVGGQHFATGGTAMPASPLAGTYGRYVTDAMVPALLGKTSTLSESAAAQAIGTGFNETNRIIAALTTSRDQLAKALASANTKVAAAVKKVDAAEQALAAALAAPAKTKAAKAAKAARVARDEAHVRDAKAAEAAAEQAAAGAKANLALAAAHAKVAAALTVDASRSEAQLKVLADKRTALVDQIKTATQTLQQLQQQSDQYASQITSSAAGTGSLTSLFFPGTGEMYDATGVVTMLNNATKATSDFDGELDKLSQAGLSEKLISQLEAAGVGQGSAMAQNILAGGPQIVAALNASETKFDAAAASLGKDAADRMYGAGVAAAKGVVAGLQSQQDAIDKQMLKIAQSMQSAIEVALGIKSPTSSALHAKIAASHPAAPSKLAVTPVPAKVMPHNTGFAGGAHTMVIVDANHQLIGRMKVVAAAQVHAGLAAMTQSVHHS